MPVLPETRPDQALLRYRNLLRALRQNLVERLDHRLDAILRARLGLQPAQPALLLASGAIAADSRCIMPAR